MHSPHIKTYISSHSTKTWYGEDMKVSRMSLAHTRCGVVGDIPRDLTQQGVQQALFTIN